MGAVRPRLKEIISTARAEQERAKYGENGKSGKVISQPKEHKLPKMAVNIIGRVSKSSNKSNTLG